jgi:ATP-dependent Lon protease
VLGAHRAGIGSVIMPKRNEKDLEDVPDVVRKAMRFLFVETIDEVLEHALERAPSDGQTLRAAQS